MFKKKDSVIGIIDKLEKVPFDEIKEILMNKECQFNFFHSSFAIDVSDYSNPVTPFTFGATSV